MFSNRNGSGISRRAPRVITALLTLCLSVAAGIPLGNAQSYSYTSLSTLGGSSGWAYDINNNGQIAGRSSVVGDAAVHATLWNGAVATDLGTLSGHTNSIAFGINDAGSIVGRSIGSSGFVATLWSGGAITDLGLGNNSTANAINSSGQVAATRLGPGGGQTVTWSGGSVVERFQTSFLRPGINDAGQVVGESANRAVLSSGGTVTALAAVPGSVFSYAMAINNVGQVVGDSVFCGACNDRATLWQDGIAIDLGTLGGSDSVASDINDAGQIVGNSKNASGDYRAVLWNTAGTIVDLNSFLDAATVEAGWVLYEANAINRDGWIVGGAINTINMTSSAFLLTPGASRLPSAFLVTSVSPVPEPETYALLMAGLGLLGAAARRRKVTVAAR